MRHFVILRVRVLPALLLLVPLVAGCATASEPGPDPSLPSAVLTGGTVRVDDAPTEADAVINAAAADLWPALQAAYASLGIAVTSVDPDGWILGNRDLQVRRKLGAARASTYFDCGSTVTGRPAADSYTITATVTTQVVPRDSTTTLITRVGATGRSMASSSDPVRCSSTGILEERIRAASLLALGRGAGS